MSTLGTNLTHIFSSFLIKNWNRPYGFTQGIIGTAIAVLLIIFLSGCGDRGEPKTPEAGSQFLTDAIFSSNTKYAAPPDTMTVFETKVVDVEGVKTEWLILTRPDGLPEQMEQVPKLSTYGDMPNGTIVLVYQCAFATSWSAPGGHMQVITALKQ